MIKGKTKILTGVAIGFLLLTTTFTNCALSFQLNLSSTTGSLSGEDPFFNYSWHLQNTGQRVFALASGSAGSDVNVANSWNRGLYGKGIKIMVSDSGVEDTHEDLQENFLYVNESKDYTKAAPYLSTTAPPYSDSDAHGTSVAGLIAAAGWNGLGSRVQWFCQCRRQFRNWWI